MDLIKEPRVSIITAFYNEELYLGKLLDSILTQSYSNIEMICVDDGSTDKSAEIVKAFIERFEMKGMNLRYIFQNNAGQAAATNRALKLVTGRYLCWIDGDDFLYSDAVKAKVDFLEAHPEYGMVTSDFFLWNEVNNDKIRKGDLYKNLNYQTNQFGLTIAGESIIENLAHMINMDLYRKINPYLEIYECREGQNYQIILPMLYHYKRGYIDRPLGCYRIHEDSHSHMIRTKQEQIIRYENLIAMLSSVLAKLGVPQKDLECIVKNSTFSIEKGRYIDNARD